MEFSIVEAIILTGGNNLVHNFVPNEQGVNKVEILINPNNYLILPVVQYSQQSMYYNVTQTHIYWLLKVGMQKDKLEYHLVHADVHNINSMQLIRMCYLLLQLMQYHSHWDHLMLQ